MAASSPEQRIESAVAKKQEGNECVAKGDFKGAAFRYKFLYLILADLLPSELVAMYNKDRGGGNNAESMGVANFVKGSASAKQPVPEELRRAAADVFVSGMNNLALCHIKLERFVEAIHCCELVLASAPQNSKALFRRASARIAVGLLDEGEEDLRTLLASSSGDADAMAKMNELASLREKAKGKEKKMFQKMFA